MSKFETDKLLISSDFYSVQGEGISSGVPIYFVRFGLCNLTCGMSNKFLNSLTKEKSLENGETFVGDLHANGEATWTCDSTSQWAWRGENKSFDYLLNRWKEEGVYDDIISGLIHICWTGGEPLMKQHQRSIVNFFTYWASIESRSLQNVYSEVETNGTIYIEDDLFPIISQINCSPKLANSGMAVNKRIVPAAIERIMQHKCYQFKFVISTENDVLEFLNFFVNPFGISLKNVVCMPGLDDQVNFFERTQFVLEMAKKYRFTGLTRLHIAAWDKTLDV